MLAQSLPYLATPSRTQLLLAGLALCVAALVVVVARLVRPAKKRHPLAGKATHPLDPFARCSPLEKRRATRRRGNSVEVLLTDASRTAKPVRGWIRDRSTGGLCVVLDRAITVSTVLHVRSANATPGTPWVQITVRNCRPWEGDWMLGCQFIKTPQWPVLLTFG
jgi:hypothetical protein